MTDAAAAEVLRLLGTRGWTIAVAESLTGGLVASTLIDVPGASASMRGGVVAYATEVKRDVLGVNESLLAVEGAVHPTVALEMAQGVRRLLKADVGVATTGVAGPEPQDGKAVGTVCLAVVTPDAAYASEIRLTGDRAAIRAAAASHALGACVARL